MKGDGVPGGMPGGKPGGRGWLNDAAAPTTSVAAAANSMMLLFNMSISWSYFESMPAVSSAERQAGLSCLALPCMQAFIF